MPALRPAEGPERSGGADASSATRTTVIRPGLIVGPGDETDRFTYWPARLARGGEVLAPGDGTDPVQFIDARDLAEWTIRMAESRTTGTLTPPARPAADDARDAGRHRRRASARTRNSPGCRPTFLDAQNVSAWTDLPVWVPGEGDSAGFARRDIGRAVHAGLTFRPLATTAVDTLAWFRAQPASARPSRRPDSRRRARRRCSRAGRRARAGKR